MELEFISLSISAKQTWESKLVKVHKHGNTLTFPEWLPKVAVSLEPKPWLFGVL